MVEPVGALTEAFLLVVMRTRAASISASFLFPQTLAISIRYRLLVVTLAVIRTCQVQGQVLSTKVTARHGEGPRPVGKRC